MSESDHKDFRGYWWLPVRPEDKVAGMLRVSGDGKDIVLTLSAPLVMEPMSKGKSLGPFGSWSGI
jgi:hypothetical protein